MYAPRLLLTTVVASILVGLASAHVSAPAPYSYMGPSGLGPSAPGPAPNDCFTQLLNLSDCLTYVEEGSNLTAPDKRCCPELAGLVDSNVTCLCALLGDGLKSLGVKLDLSRALKLPSACRVSTPPASLCSAVGHPVAAPTSSELATTPELAPNTDHGDNLGNEASGITAGSSQAFFVGLAFAACRLTFF
ncbi:hypothetical protein K2173_008338 [Erythroxylum novogranatense]|uniref:Bifunctional inhibitor/plant lipid transfer protein/seed storage helical domain-containing protein n=1 Tax=Erythroxylum novogranatense TaxID=1862640 RepID=A0AAV8TLF6_9ROSI|nr:hypothetical protein K2173_008338 [Erythroxylum novogranatense]